MNINLETEKIYWLENETAQKRLVDHLMNRSDWTVCAPSKMQFPVMIQVKDDYKIHLSTLETLIKINDIWYPASSTVNQVGKKSVNALVVNV